jgi:hypothetical protein
MMDGQERKTGYNSRFVKAGAQCNCDKFVIFAV